MSQNIGKPKMAKPILLTISGIWIPLLLLSLMIGKPENHSQESVLFSLCGAGVLILVAVMHWVKYVQQYVDYKISEITASSDKEL